MAHIYISYNHADQTTARRIAFALREAGHRVWTERPANGASYAGGSIYDRALRKSAYFIVLLSPHAGRDGLIRREMLLARRLGKRLIPIMVAPLPIGEPPLIKKFIDGTSNLEKLLPILLKIVDGDGAVLGRYLRGEPVNEHGQELRRMVTLAVLLIPALMIGGLLIFKSTSGFDENKTPTAQAFFIGDRPSPVPGQEEVPTDAQPSPTDELSRTPLPQDTEPPPTLALDTLPTEPRIETEPTVEVMKEASPTLEMPSATPHATNTYPPPSFFSAEPIPQPTEGVLVAQNPTIEFDSPDPTLVPSTTPTISPTNGSSEAVVPTPPTPTPDVGNYQDRPMASFSVSALAGDAPLTVSFTNTSFGEMDTYAWDFDGDGVMDSIVTDPPPFTYTTPGMYHPSLVVAGAGGESDPFVELITVYAPEVVDADDGGGAENPIVSPQVQFTAAPQEGTAPLSVTFTNQSIGDIAAYEWDFDHDGVVDSTSANPPAYTYAEAGGYLVELAAIGTDGERYIATAVIVVWEPAIEGESPDEAGAAPLASFAASPSQGDAPLTVNFSNESSGPIAAYEWDFNGDGISDHTSPSPPPFTYSAPGTYSTSLTVTSPDGRRSTDTAFIAVQSSGSASARISASPTIGDAPLTVNFFNESSGSITAYAWDFNGDGMSDHNSPSPPPFTYSAAGTYLVTLTVSAADGSTASESLIIVVEAAPDPIPLFSVTPTSGAVPLAVSITNISSGSITAYSWDFNGDGIPDSVDPNPPTALFEIPGTYTISLTVTSVQGAQFTASQQITAEEDPTRDTDGDGSPDTLDCDLHNPVIYPNAPEIPNDGIDQDCDGADLSLDTDGDGSPDNLDCAPDNPAIYPNAPEIPNDGIDQDCDGADLSPDGSAVQP